jgi:D-alanine-D-alanine ligase
VSLQTGQNVLQWLPSHFERADILITKDGQWHWQGLPIKPAELAGKVDVVFNALHGEYGEDGRIQNLLDQLGLPYTGSTTLASAVAMKKSLAKQALAKLGVKTPYGVLITAELSPREAASLIFNKLGPPWVIKPDDRGSSVGLQLVRQLAQLPAAVAQARRFSDRVLVEEYIRGREATCGVINHFRDIETYVLPAIEIRRPNHQAVWHYQDKYSGATEEVCPGWFNEEEKSKISEIAALAHQQLGLRHYSRSDFIVSPRGVYWLEVNTLPGLTQHSLLPKSLDAVGCSYDGFLHHLINLALSGRK